MRYLLAFLLLAGCTATQWQKPGATVADQDRDFEECRQIAKPDPAIAAAFGAFGAVGVFFGVNTTDAKIRSCMAGRGWNPPQQANEPAQRAQMPTQKGSEGVQPVSATPGAK